MSNRSEVYKFYRSIGYTPAQARKARNRTKAVIKDYSEAVKKGAKKKGLYRPSIKPSKVQTKQFTKRISKFRIPPDIIAVTSGDLLKQDLYLRRFAGLERYFDDKPMNLDEVVNYISSITDPKEWFGAIDELYDEFKTEDIIDESRIRRLEDKKPIPVKPKPRRKAKRRVRHRNLRGKGRVDHR